VFDTILDRVLGRRPLRRRAAPRSRLTIPSVVPQLPDVLRQLRALRSDLDYYVEHDGWVLLLAHDPAKPRVHEARKMLALGLDTFDNRIMADGFSILQMLEPHATWSGELVRAAQSIVDQATPRAVEAAHRARVAAVDGTVSERRGEAHLRDALTGDSTSDHKIFFRGKRSFSTSTIRRALNDPVRQHAAAQQARREREVRTAAAMLRANPSLPILR
jgi:hypothetical protein